MYKGNARHPGAPAGDRRGEGMPCRGLPGYRGLLVAAGLLGFAVLIASALLGKAPVVGENTKGGDVRVAAAVSRALPDRGLSGGGQTGHAGEVHPLPDAGGQHLTCPFDFTGAQFADGRTNSLGRGWTYVTDEDVGTLVEEALMQSRDQGFELVGAVTLDLEGNAWGCVVTDRPGEITYLVIIGPVGLLDPEGEITGGLAAQDDNLCAVTAMGGSDV